MTTTRPTAPTGRRRPRSGDGLSVPTTGTAPEHPTDNPAVRAVHGTARFLEAAQSELPRSSWPVVVGAGALVLTGVLDLPAAAGVTALYLVARHWPRPQHEPVTRD